MEINKEVFIKLIWKYTEKVKSSNSSFSISDWNLVIKITSSCFNDCIFCPHKEEETDIIYVINSLLKINIDNVTDVYIVGEEPLYDIRILNLLDVVWYKKIHIMTSLNWIDSIFIDKLLRYNIKTITTSLYWLGKIHDNIVWNKWAFDNLLNNIKYLKLKWISIDVNCLILKQNISYIKDLVDFWNLNNLNMYFMFPRLKSKVFDINYILSFKSLLENLNNFNFYIFNIPLCIWLKINSDYLEFYKNTYLNKLNDIYLDNTIFSKIIDCKKCLHNDKCKWFPIFMDKLYDNINYIKPIISNEK